MDFPENAVTIVRYAMFTGFIGIGFGALMGTICRGIMSVIGIFNKIVK